MFKAGAALIVVGLAVAAIGSLSVESMSAPLLGGWHFTLFPRGVGVLLVVAGIGVVAVSALRAYARGRTDG